MYTAYVYTVNINIKHDRAWLKRLKYFLRTILYYRLINTSRFVAHRRYVIYIRLDIATISITAKILTNFGSTNDLIQDYRGWLIFTRIGYSIKHAR